MVAPRARSVATIIVLRSVRSTIAPANSPNSSQGSRIATVAAATARGSLVIWAVMSGMATRTTPSPTFEAVEAVHTFQKFRGSIDRFIRQIPVGRWRKSDAIHPLPCTSLFRQSGDSGPIVAAIADYAVFAAVYRKSPVGLTAIEDLPPRRRSRAFQPALSPEENKKLHELLQKLALEAVVSEPMSGFKM